jgi:hypothetical protein
MDLRAEESEDIFGVVLLGVFIVGIFGIAPIFVVPTFGMPTLFRETPLDGEFALREGIFILSSELTPVLM